MAALMALNASDTTVNCFCSTSYGPSVGVDARRTFFEGAEAFRGWRISTTGTLRAEGRLLVPSPRSSMTLGSSEISTTSLRLRLVAFFGGDDGSFLMRIWEVGGGSGDPGSAVLSCARERLKIVSVTCQIRRRILLTIC